MICDPLLIWMANSWLRQISPHCARQRGIQTRPTTCQGLISSQNCNTRDVSLWLPRQGPIQFQSSQQIESLWVFVECWSRFWLVLFIGYSFLYEVSIAALKLRELKLQMPKICKGVGWSFGVCIFQTSSAVHPLPGWLGLLYFPIGVSEWISSADVIKFADASFFHTGRKRWGFKRPGS